MTQFALAHPWMTFWLIVLGFFTLDSIGTSIANALRKTRPTPNGRGESR